MDRLHLIVILLRYILQVLGSTTIQLDASVHDEFVLVNGRLSFTCRTSAPISIIVFVETVGGSKTEVLLERIKDICHTTPPENIECFCNSSEVFSCAIKSLTEINDGKNWRCESIDNNKNYIVSNNYTIKLAIPLSSITLVPGSSVAYPVYDETSTFTCTSSKSRPGASIYWFEDNRNITNHANLTYSTGIAKSTLLYTTNNATNRFTLRCIATYTYKTFNISLQNASQLQIQYPVSRPNISINNNIISETVSIREGLKTTFNCSSYVGFPSPSYRWLTPGGYVDSSEVTLQFNRTDRSMSCEATNTFYTLNGGLGNRTTKAVTTLQLNVLYPSTNIRFYIAQTQGSVDVDTHIRVQRGDTIVIKCEADANPPALVYWNTPDTNSTMILTSVQNDTISTCYAYNTILGTTQPTITKYLSITVLYGPSSPTIMFSILPNVSNVGTVEGNKSINLIEGSSVQFMCSSDSTPAARYVWDNGHEGNTLRISNITREKRLNYTCEVENIMDTSFGGKITSRNHKSILLNLLYGPENLLAKYNMRFAIDQVLKVIQGWSFNISCVASSSPMSNISWQGPGTQMGDFLTIIEVKTTMTNNATCTATNTMVDSLGRTEVKSQNLKIELDILYPPITQYFSDETVVINKSISIVCNLSNIGNPPASNFTWIEKKTGSVLSTEQTLVISNVKQSTEGYYICNATNEMKTTGENKTQYGYSQSQFFLDVQYDARILAFYANTLNSRTVYVTQGQAVELICSVDGDPVPFVRIVNSTIESKINLTVSRSLNATVAISHARCEYDVGLYICQTKNNHNLIQQEQNLKLVVHCAPRASPFSPPTTSLYKALNDTAILNFTIMAYPEPTNVTWYRRVNTDLIVLLNESNYQMSISKDKMQMHMMIMRLNWSDFGEYVVNVSNEIGSSNETFYLFAQDKPDIPKELQVIRRGKYDIVVKWTPGFNGGDDQSFTLRYTELGIGRWKDAFIPVSVQNYTTTLHELKPGTTYQIKMFAENKIGRSNWTNVIEVLTLADDDDANSILPVVGGVVGSILGISIIIAAGIMIWKYKIRAMRESNSRTKLKPRSSTQHIETTTYENIGMLTPTTERKIVNTNKVMLEPQTNIPKAGYTEASTNMIPSDSSILKSRIDPPASPVHRTKEQELDNSIRGSSHKSADASVDLHKRNSFKIEHDPLYDNLYKNKKQIKSRDISIQNLRDTVIQDNNNKTDVFTEFSALNAASEKIKYSTNAAMKPANISKNRYRNMYPYDKNRVTLSVMRNDIDTDFINASFIDGYSSPRKYIAAQGPLAGTIGDFWRMIWEQNVKVVVMVTNLVEDSKRKCYQYWPTDSENDSEYSDFKIHLLSEETYADFVIRTLRCTKSGSAKDKFLTHLHFTAWPDKDVPESALSLMQFWRKVRLLETPDDVPWIVHCSAGVGQTGTFIALDYLYDQGVKAKTINVYDAVLLLREQRINMVQTKKQYLYLHEVLCETLCSVGDVVPNKEYVDIKRTTDSLNQEYEKICQSHIPDREEENTDGDYIKVLDGEKPENINKNADLRVIPDDKYRPILNMTVNVLGHTNYINAVYISTFGMTNRLILTQSARKSSAIDFVRLLHDHYVKNVVTFYDQVEPFMPVSGDSSLIGPFTATTVSNNQKENIQESVVKFKHIAELHPIHFFDSCNFSNIKSNIYLQSLTDIQHDSFEVRLFRFTKWSQNVDICNIKDMMNVLVDVQASACERPVVLQCRDGYSRSGLVAVLWCLMERSKRDAEVAVADTVRAIRRRREQVIKNETQYRFCHEFMKEYIQGCLLYANT